ncbi:MAG: S8 family serine peptidase, partial [Armatimonadetes bacterium]|nr:S8 family serine peptidase [Armatimonadota bacterium]
LGFLQSHKERGNVAELRPFFIINAVAVEATRDVIATIAKMPGVVRVTEDKVVQIPPLTRAPRVLMLDAAEWNIAKVRAPEVWAMGIDGSGVVVGSIDTGVDYTHPDLATKWRGYPSDPVGNWVDCVNGYSMPYDDYGHGTHTTGTICGGNAGGTDIGVAPGAQWIHAKAFDSGGSGYDSWILAAMEWMLDPDGDGDPVDAPAVVSNSWGGYGYDETLRAATQAWRAAGIFPSFSIGNDGSSPGSTGNPGNYPESFAAGATDSGDVIAYFSSRGPSPYDEEPADGTDDIKPDVSAPGVSVWSSIPDGGYMSADGTSMACPHVSGLAALLLQLNPSATLDELETRIRDSAVDLGPPGPDYDYGSGRIDCLAAAEPWAGTSVSGHVSCMVDGWAMYGVTITALALNPEVGPTRTATTNENGDYTLFLSDGTWRVSATKDGWEPFTPEYRDVTVPPEATGVDFASAPLANGGLSGTVTTSVQIPQSVESPHPYPNSAWLEYPLTGPAGAERIRAHFSQIDVEHAFDDIYIYDNWGNYVTSYTGSNTLRDGNGTINPTSTTGFTAGVWTDNVTITSPYTAVTITTSGGGQSGVSNA